MRTLVVALAWAAVLVTATAAAPGDVTDTWKKRVEVNPAGAAGPVPVVLYVHGCSGAFAAVGLAALPSMPLLAIEFSSDSFLSVQGRCSEALQKAQVTYLEVMIRLHEMQHSGCVVSDDPRRREPGR